MAFDWSTVLTESFQDLWTGVLSFAPNIIIALIIILLGWFIGILVGQLVKQIIAGIKLDSSEGTQRHTTANTLLWYVRSSQLFP